MNLASMQLALGIDIGTTKVAVVLVDLSSRQVIASQSAPHGADIRELAPGRSEQSVALIRSVLDGCIGQLSPSLRQTVSAIGITGQMHGVMLWSPSERNTSHLITWQDQRCLENGFVRELQIATGSLGLQTGFGCSTLAWFARHDPHALTRYQCASTVHDYFAALLTGRPQAACDPTGAASWGLFNLRTSTWDLAASDRAKIPRRSLPEVLPCGAMLGGLVPAIAEQWGIPAGTPVMNGIGDNQASLFGSLKNPHEQIAINIGTGAQVSVVLSSLPSTESAAASRLEFRPYVDGSYIAVGASLAGGRPLATLATALASFMRDAGVEEVPSLDDIQSTMHRLGLERKETALVACSSFGGERFDPALTGSIAGITFDNLSIGDLTAAMCHGVVRGLRDMLSPELLVGRNVVVGSGNAICLSPLMQATISDLFDLPLLLDQGVETTAVGAALLAARSSL